MSDDPKRPADLPPRKESFLARYPRNLKLAAVAVLLAVVVLPWIFTGYRPANHHGPMRTPIAVTVNGADQKAAIANPRAANKVAAAGDNIAAGGESEDNQNVTMAPAPDPGLTEDTPDGSLPRIGEDGRQPWQVYARPFNTSDKRPRIAVVITSLGLSRIASDTAIDRLPPNVTLAFDVQSPVVGAWAQRARQAGHETLLEVPMEPFDYPRSDPGPNTLLTNLPNTDNIQRFLWALRQSTGYIGVMSLTGSRFTTDPVKLKPILDILRQRGLMIFDAKVAPHSALADLARDEHVPVAVNTLRIDENLAPDAIDAALAQIEQTARLTGRAVGIAGPSPVVIDHLIPWLRQLSHDGVALAPLSAMVE